MPIHVALLRGINVGGHNKVEMAALRKLCQDLGLAGVKSVLQSGNLVFQSERLSGDALDRLLERETAERLGVAADYLIRSAVEWEQIVVRNPFAKEAVEDPSHLLVMCLKEAPSAQDVGALRSSFKGPEFIREDGKQLYLVYPAGIGRSKLTSAVIEQKLGVRGTARNWNTILKLLALCK